MTTENMKKENLTMTEGKSLVVLPEEGQTIQAFNNILQIKLAAEQTGGLLTVGLLQIPPGAGPPPHRHQQEDELFLILEGHFRFLIHGEWIEAGPGALVYAPRGIVHTFQNIGQTLGKAWVLATPSGFESFFSECAIVFAAAEDGPPDITRIVEISTEHGIEYVPPLL